MRSGSRGHALRRSRSGRSLSLDRRAVQKGARRHAAAGVVLMGLGMMVGFGRYAPLLARSDPVGVVRWKGLGDLGTTRLVPDVESASFALGGEGGLGARSEVMVEFPSLSEQDVSVGKDEEPEEEKKPHGRPGGHRPVKPPPTWQRAIGRVSAWSCTVLYLTSRMPQIWKNVRFFFGPLLMGLASFVFVRQEKLIRARVFF